MPSLLPSDVTTLRASGSADMGTVGDATTPGSFRHPMNVPWALVYIRLHFEDLSGSAAGVADCVPFRDRDGDQTAWNARTVTLRDRGIVADAGDADVNMMILPEEYVAWTFDADESLTLVWTNPDSGNIGWGAEIGVAPAAAVTR